MRYGDHFEFVDCGEVPWVAGVKREVVGHGDGGDHGVVGAGGWFASRPAQASGDPTEASSGVGVERERFEIGLGLLDVSLTGRSFIVGGGHKWTDRELGQSDRRDQGFGGELVDVFDPPEHYERACVEDPAGHGSEGRVEDLVEFVSQLVGVDGWKLPMAGEDCVQRLWLGAKWSQLGHRLSRARDREVFTFGHSVHDVAAMVAEFPDRDFRHAVIVSHVRQR
jgi:hypothetical protein